MEATKLTGFSRLTMEDAKRSVSRLGLALALVAAIGEPGNSSDPLSLTARPPAPPLRAAPTSW
jgi:hypothetical protein